MTQVYRVELTEGAGSDVAEIYASIARDYSPDATEDFLKDVEKAIEALEQFPDRGSVPNELAGLGGPVRQRHIGAYRAVYRVSPGLVSILFVVHRRPSLHGRVARRAVRPQRPRGFL